MHKLSLKKKLSIELNILNSKKNEILACLDNKVKY